MYDLKREDLKTLNNELHLDSQGAHRGPAGKTASSQHHSYKRRHFWKNATSQGQNSVGERGLLNPVQGRITAWVMDQWLRKIAARPSSFPSRSMLLQRCKIMFWTKEKWRTYPPAKELFFFHRVFRGTGQAWHLSRLFFDILSPKCMSETCTHKHNAHIY